jgi:hypothetical protein
MMRIASIFALAAALFSAPAAAQKPATPPAPQWTVNVAQGQCTLERALIGKIPVALSIQTLTGSDSYRVAIAGKGIPKFQFDTIMDTTILFGAADSRFQRDGLLVRVGGEFGNALIFSGLQRDLIDAFAAASTISFDYGIPGLGPYPIPRAGAAIKALDGCIRDQLVEWGADPAQFEPGGKTPVALKPREDWVPSPALLRMLQNRRSNMHALFRVGISPEGAIDGCEMIGSSDLDPKPACEAIQGQRLFTPATDPAGKPVRGAATFEVRLVARPGL